MSLLLSATFIGVRRSENCTKIKKKGNNNINKLINRFNATSTFRRITPFPWFEFYGIQAIQLTRV